MFTNRPIRPRRSVPAILLAALAFLAAGLVVASPAAAAPISNPSLEIPVACPGARAVIQVTWEGTRSARVHWELTDSGADRESPVIKMVARDPSGAGASWVFPDGAKAFTLSGGKGSSASGVDSWDPAGIAQFNHLEISVRNGADAETAECSVVRKIYNFSRLAYADALSQSDKSYVLNTAGPNTFDCSGLVHFTYNRVANFPNWSRMSSAQQHSWASSAASDNNSDLSNLHSRDAIKVSRGELQTGDLIFYDGHVGYYAGDGRMYSALNPTLDIGYTDVDYTTPLGYYRVVGVTS
ncbi:NlpC/P60 family protein [Kribbella sp. NPDC058245]|uniref:NlpC/P60 family protein n=1 Tax=Kribbella sp. NPDC058245 TaxID=3346399 RepID=UPI0036EBA459